MLFTVTVEVMPKDSVADPEGATIARSLDALGFPGVAQVRAGKVYQLSLEVPSEDVARSTAQDMAGKLLANPVIELATITTIARIDVAGVR
ncbi:MAG: phosphoribosylformylglycinamidine synthase subunit PurS [Actinobacteria bacterium]|nr:phosphoribosylformylglycinamidine synthase subunit PurS [Actinomycetota bacterium]MCL5447534.1 phosphoribosylformylglycinamidine synthase subunit PurS [Actinomycetota bacterium]